METWNLIHLISNSIALMKITSLLFSGLVTIPLIVTLSILDGGYMLKEIGSVFSFLTIIPTSNANLETIAKYMYIFPIVGIVIGLIVGGFGFGLSEVGIDPLIVGLLVVVITAIITGIHHTDGLADFADGLMVKGTMEKNYLQ